MEGLTAWTVVKYTAAVVGTIFGLYVMFAVATLLVSLGFFLWAHK